jgi:tetratricopeptide (TPR) repeat protein
MKRENATADFLSPPAEQIELALARIEDSAAFRTSARHRHLLRHLVGRVLDDDLSALKETVIAVEVFGRPASSFDPKHDTIVRVEARRLRARLSTYYRTDGRDTQIRIELPVGGYVPTIGRREHEVKPDSDATRRARDLVERGEHFLRLPLSRETLQSAADRFRQAQVESPSYAPAWTGEGRAWLNLATGWYVQPAVASEHAALSLHRALEIDPDNAVAHVLLGAIQHQFERDWPAAQQSFSRALALAPNEHFVHSAYGCHLTLRNRLADAERELSIARRLDPQYINTRNHMVNLRIAQGRLADAQLEIDAMRDIAPNVMAVVGLSAALAMFRGEPEVAIPLYEMARDAAPDHAAVHVLLASAHAVTGNIAMAEALMLAVRQRFSSAQISPFVLAVFETRCGRHDEAIALLQRTVAEQDPLTVQIGLDTSFAGLRSHPQWRALVEASRLPA